MKKILTLVFVYSLFLFSTDLFGQAPVSSLNNPAVAYNTPCVSADGLTLILLSNKNGNWQLFQSKRSTIIENWSEPQAVSIQGVLSSSSIELQDPSLNATGNILYFSAITDKTKGTHDIYYSEFKDGQWQTPVNLNVVNTIAPETAPRITTDNSQLFFVRQYVGENEDEFYHKIFFVKKLEDQSWSEPIMLSSSVNVADENYPFLSADNKVLFYASKQESDLKGYNLYYSKRYAENIWAKGEPLTSLNSDLDDISPSMAINEKKLYYVRFEQTKKTTVGTVFDYTHLEQFNIQNVFKFEGKVSNKATGEPMQAQVLIRDNSNMQIIDKITTNDDGTYLCYYPKGRVLSFEIYNDNYSHTFYEFNTLKAECNEEKLVQIESELFSNVKLILNVFDEEIFEPLAASLKITNSKGEVLPANKLVNKGSGRYELTLGIGDSYTANIQAKNYETYDFKFDLKGTIQFYEFERDVEMVPSKSAFEINISDVETDQTVDEVEIVITNLEKNETIVKKVRKDENGKFMVDLRDGDKYEINVNGPKGYAFYNTKVDMAEGENKKLDVKLQPLKAKTKLVLNDITFETNSAELNASSFEELDRVVKLLNDNPEIKIEISAHTDDVGSAAYNQKLSGRRAQSVVDYLVLNHLAENRLIAKGYGESNPVVPNDSEENKAKNRRVELKIIDANEN